MLKKFIHIVHLLLYTYVQDPLTKSNTNTEPYSFSSHTSFGEYNFVSHDVSTIFVVFHGF